MKKPTTQERIFTAGAAVGVERGKALEREAAIRDVAEGLLRLDVSDAVSLIKEHGAKNALPLIAQAAREAWVGRWRSHLAPLLARAAKDAVAQTDRGPVRLGFDVTAPNLAEAFDGYVTKVAGDVTSTTRDSLTDIIHTATQEGLSVPETAKRIRELGAEFTKSRSELIAANELHRAQVTATEIQMRQSGIVDSRTWLSSRDNRVRPSHRALEGVTVGMNEPFPGGISSPGVEIRCRCVCTYNLAWDKLGKLA